MGVKIRRIQVGTMQTNCYLVYMEGESQAICIDPGADPKKIIHAAKEEQVEIRAILLTHGHFDHIEALAEVEKKMEATVYYAKKEKELLADPALNLSKRFHEAISFHTGKLLENGDVIAIGSMEIRVIETPGHTSGSVCYYIEKERKLFSGDTLFASSVGRTDFPTGNFEELYRSVREVLFAFPEDTIVYPGHGGETTIAFEKNNNMMI